MRILKYIQPCKHRQYMTPSTLNKFLVRPDNGGVTMTTRRALLKSVHVKATIPYCCKYELFFSGCVDYQY